MRITDDAVNEFIQLYEEEFGERLSGPEARELASNLCELYLILLSPTPSEQKAHDEEEEMKPSLTQPSPPSANIH
jgi:hypothetical protein